MRKFAPFILFAALMVSGAGTLPSSADTPLPPPLAAPPLAQMTPRQKAQAQQIKTLMQAIYTKMDAALQNKDKAAFLSYRHPRFAEVDCHGAWRSTKQCRGDVDQLFAGLLSAKKHSVVQNVTVTPKLTEVFVTRHGSLVARDIHTKLYANTIVDAVCRDIFIREGDRWMQYRSYTMAEQVYVNGKLVRS